MTYTKIKTPSTIEDLGYILDEINYDGHTAHFDKDFIYIHGEVSAEEIDYILMGAEEIKAIINDPIDPNAPTIPF